VWFSVCLFFVNGLWYAACFVGFGNAKNWLRMMYFLQIKIADVLLEWSFFDDVRFASLFFLSIYTAGYIDRKTKL